MTITQQIEELLALDIAALDNRTPALLLVLRALLEERDSRMPYMGATDADYDRSRRARAQTDAAIREAEKEEQC